MTEPLIEVALKLTGQGFSPQEVTALIQLTPTKTWRIGDRVQSTLLTRKNDGWLFGLPQRATYELDAVLTEFLDAIEPYGDKIIEAANCFGLEKEISLGIYVDRETPIGRLGAETLSRVAALGMNLDLDYILMEMQENGS
jgi:hypothetical protein